MIIIKIFDCDQTEKLMSLSKTALRPIPDDLTFPFGQETFKNYLIKNTSNIMLKNHGNAANGTLSLTDEEERSKSVIQFSSAQVLAIFIMRKGTHTLSSNTDYHEKEWTPSNPTWIVETILKDLPIRVR